MNKAIYKKLIEVAQKQSTITYSKIAPLAGLDMGQPPDRKTLGDLLCEISAYEHENKRPLLSAVVIRDVGKRPGSGFFKFAKSIGQFDGRDELSFFAKELQAVHQAWKGK